MRFVALFFGLVLTMGALFAQPVPPPIDADVTQGALRVRKADGDVVECPLKHTAVKGDISGFIARVQVMQTFVNTAKDKIEAVYVFPLPNTAAVDGMTMVIGDRRIVGVIKKRADARQLYEEALSRGATASLLEQERPNIFTQSVGNIKPGQEVRIEITYLDVLRYDMGSYEFHFPMVVGPRYIPGGNRVPDAARVTPPVVKPGQRNGQDISLSLTLDAGVPIHAIHTSTHRSNITPVRNSGSKVMLLPDDAIPNKDFILRYKVAGEKPQLALLAHKPESGDGYFMLMMQPSLDDELLNAPPREMVFLVDVSGSMSGAPTEKVKQTMREFFKRARPDDTIQVIIFFSDARKLFEKPVPATEANVARALNFTEGLSAGGGTEMLKGVQMTLREPVDPKRVRIVVMLTDGYIGNETEIIDLVGKYAGDDLRFWTLGIGSSPNRYLLDGVAKQGGGKSAVIDLNTNPEQIVTDAVERMHRAQLAKIKLDWGGLAVHDVLPRKIPDLWAGAPVVLFGKYAEGGTGKVTTRGTAEGNPLSFSVDVSLPHSEYGQHDVLPQIWARQKIDDLTMQMVDADDIPIIEEITRVALDYHLMSQYTSLVAIDVADLGAQSDFPTPPRRVAVPVPMPEGVSYEGVFGVDAVTLTDATAVMVKDDADAPMPVATTGLASGAVHARLRGPARAAMSPAPMPNFSAAPKPPPPAPRIASLSSVNMMGALRGSSGGVSNTPIPTTAYRMAAVESSVLKIPPLRAQIHDVGRIGVNHLDTSALVGKSNPAYATRANEHLRATIIPERVYHAANEAMEIAEGLLKDGKPEMALLKAQHSLFLTRIVGSDHYPAAVELVNRMRQACLKVYAKALPDLDKRLNLVIRNKSLEEALGMIAGESGLMLKVGYGTADAKALLDTPELRVTYLDLRHATVAQALEWTLTPLMLSWQVADGNVVIDSTPRMGGASAWVYNVSPLVTPAAEELADAAKAKAAADLLPQLLQAVRAEIGHQGDDPQKVYTAYYLDANYIMVYGDQVSHEHTAELLQALSRRMPPLKGYEGLQLATATHAAAWEKGTVERRGHEARLAMIQAMHDWSWALMADAYRNTLNLEALTYLQAAWISPEMETVLTGPYRLVALRSAWAISRAARRLPNEAELNILARQAYSKAGGQLATLIAALGEKPDDATRYLCLLYATLAAKTALPGAGDPAGPVAQATALLTAMKDRDVYRVITRSLFTPTAADTNALTRYFAKGKLHGADLIILGLQAAAQTRGGAWAAARRTLPELLGSQRLDGNIVLLANRMADAYEREWAKQR